MTSWRIHLSGGPGDRSLANPSIWRNRLSKRVWPLRVSESSDSVDSSLTFRRSTFRSIRVWRFRRSEFGDSVDPSWRFRRSEFGDSVDPSWRFRRSEFGDSVDPSLAIPSILGSRLAHPSIRVFGVTSLAADAYFERRRGNLPLVGKGPGNLFLTFDSGYVSFTVVIEFARFFFFW